MKRKISSLKRVEEEMCYMERDGLKGSHQWKNKNNYRTTLVNEIFGKRTR